MKMYRIIILSVVFYGCETWLLTLREESRLKGVREYGTDIWASKGRGKRSGEVR